jgi:hypothetical protein
MSVIRGNFFRRGLLFGERFFGEDLLAMVVTPTAKVYEVRENPGGSQNP